MSELDLVAATVMRCGAPEQQARFIPTIRLGVEIWCRGYSKPNSGADLASDRTGAIEDESGVGSGDESAA